MTRKTSFMVHNIFASIAAGLYVDTRATKSKYIPPKLALHNYMGYQFHILTNITMFTYIIPVNCNAQILNGSKDPEKGFDVVIL